MSNQPKPPTSFSEPEALRILNRATELEDTIGKRFTVDDLRQIAATAGIDAHALEHAMNETAIVPYESADGSPNINSTRLVLLAGSGVVLGALALAADGSSFAGGSAVPVLAPSGLFAAWLALRHPLRAGMPTLLKELAITFGSFITFFLAVEGSQALAPTVAWSTLCGVLGWGIVSLRGGTRSAAPVSADVR